MSAQEINSYIRRRFPRFGINKTMETARLLYEIAKREKISFKNIIPPSGFKRYFQLRRHLLRRRYPVSYARTQDSAFYLPKLEILPENSAGTAKLSPAGRVFKPKNIFVESSAAHSWLAMKTRRTFPDANFRHISSLKEARPDGSSGIENYNRRRENLFIISEKHDFYKPCPCTKNAVNCGYNILNLGFGCPYECVYCYLQEYQNIRGMILPANIQDFFRKFDKESLKPGIFKIPRIGTGQFMDSLAFDDLTEFSVQIMDFFREHPDVSFEFKTKSPNIENILKSPPLPNIVVSWSLNPPRIINSAEFMTSKLSERLSCARTCAEAGFKLGFHFDPVIHYTGWEKDYRETVDRLFDSVKPKDIAWISVGALRFHPALKKIIENRFPKNSMLDGELIPGFDGKLRYERSLRREIYRKMAGWIRKRAAGLMLYLCMEEAAIGCFSKPVDRR